MKLYAYFVFYDDVSNKIVVNYKICFNIEEGKKRKKNGSERVWYMFYSVKFSGGLEFFWIKKCQNWIHSESLLIKNKSLVLIGEYIKNKGITFLFENYESDRLKKYFYYYFTIFYGFEQIPP